MKEIVAIDILFSQNRKKDLAALLVYKKAIFMVLSGLPTPKYIYKNIHEGDRGYRNHIFQKKEKGPSSLAGVQKQVLWSY